MKPSALCLLLATSAVAAGCTGLALDSVGDALSEPGKTYAQDDDPELVREATAFGLKTIETLIEARPEHEGLHVAASRGFTQYAFAFLQSEADYAEEDDYHRAKHLRYRALRMYRRALRYGLAGLAIEDEDFLKDVRKDPKATLADWDDGEDAERLFWTALPWAAAVSLDKDDADLAADLDVVEAIMVRVREIAPDAGCGQVHDFFLTWEAGRPAAAGASMDRAKAAYERALNTCPDQRVGPHVTWAELVSVKSQDREEFTRLLGLVLAFDADSAPDHRLANLVAQKRARWLMAQADDLFIE